MVSITDLLIVLFTTFGFGLIPFTGPSTLFIASNSALILGVHDPPTLIAIAFLVALGSSLAKSVHYMVTFFVSKSLSEKRQQRLNEHAKKINRWAGLLLFVVATTPIPDDPVVIPLGLTKYSPYKFFTAFFAGKLIITLIGAFLGSWTGKQLSEWFTPEATIVTSIILTVVATVVLLKLDLNELAEKIMRRIKH